MLQQLSVRRLGQLQRFEHVKLRLSAVSQALLVGRLVRLTSHEFVSAKSLKFDDVSTCIGRGVDQLMRCDQRAVVVDASLGNDASWHVSSRVKYQKMTSAPSEVLA